MSGHKDCDNQHPNANAELKLGIPECWLVNLLEGCIEVYREPAGDAYKSVRRYTPDGAIAPEWAVPVRDALKV